jgi:hypothetical protein
MILSHAWRAIPIFLIALVLLIPVAEAQQPFDITYCSSGVMTTVSASPELTVLSLDTKGIFRSNHENKVFDNVTFHSVVVAQVMPGKVTGTGYCKCLDPDGDIIVAEVILAGPEDTYKFIWGTGKWKGIKGGGKALLLTPQAKSITPDSRQICRKFTGTFELPK